MNTWASIKKSSPALTAGTRASKLSVAQSRDAVRRLEETLPLQISLREFSSPGDRDRLTDLRESPPDFFTRDLDDAILQGKLDLAIHSAKDLPYPVPAGLDWFWLPWREDSRDAVILRSGVSVEQFVQTGGIIGVSSARREEYCQKHFPNAQLASIRGNIEERLALLDAGKFDALIMASAALHRLDLSNRITAYIPIEELTPPEGQGVLAITFRAGDKRMLRLRSLFVRPVVFVGAGPGRAELCTVAGIDALRHADVCLHDALLDPILLKNLPPTARTISVGKRCGSHQAEQTEINRLLADLSREGKNVVRLKGGDPGIFGRLAEEVETLDALSLPYRIIPGVSSLSAGTTGTGLLLTRRGVSRGFSVMTPRTAGGEVGSISAETRAKLPLALFMSVSELEQVARELTPEYSGAPVSIVFAAGTERQKVFSGTLENIHEQAPDFPPEEPGIILIGEVADPKFLYARPGALAGRRVLLTVSQDLQEEAVRQVRNFDGIPISLPLIKLVNEPSAKESLKRLPEFDWLVITSPSAVRCLFELLEEMNFDLRRIPRLLCAGAGTAREFRARGIVPELEPAENLGAKGVVRLAKEKFKRGDRVLRLRSDAAGEDLANVLRELDVDVSDVVLYRNLPAEVESLPEFDAVFFASGSAVEVFAQRWGTKVLKDKNTLAIGEPTAESMTKHGLPVTLVSYISTVPEALFYLARYAVACDLHMAS